MFLDHFARNFERQKFIRSYSPRKTTQEKELQELWYIYVDPQTTQQSLVPQLLEKYVGCAISCASFSKSNNATDGVQLNFSVAVDFTASNGYVHEHGHVDVNQ